MRDLAPVVGPHKREPRGRQPALDAVHGRAEAGDDVQQLGGVEPEADTGADLAVLRGLLVDVDGDGVGGMGAGAEEVVQEERAREPADGAADDGDAEGLGVAGGGGGGCVGAVHGGSFFFFLSFLGGSREGCHPGGKVGCFMGEQQ